MVTSRIRCQNPKQRIKTLDPGGEGATTRPVVVKVLMYIEVTLPPLGTEKERGDAYRRKHSVGSELIAAQTADFSVLLLCLCLCCQHDLANLATPLLPIIHLASC
ncbi:unnamed protein product [Pleuronectes platessa]|uniref:Uncharacterized protein n=1 Tax=Pleuronectes platessa TaxID=8262 RepID=A0A9N7UUJ8_PLEPL|nr:unnamed protein product [Pleuronectes platessa]